MVSLDPITCPEDCSRNSIAMYYYTDGRSDDNAIHFTKNTTNWKKNQRMTRCLMIIQSRTI